MRISRFHILASLLPASLAISACGINGFATSTPTDAPQSPPISPTSTAFASTTPDENPAVPTQTPSNWYLNSEYQFAFKIPSGWILDEGTWEEMEGPLHYIHLHNGHFRIALHYKTVFEEVLIGPRGMAQGELVRLDEIPILQRDFAGYSLVFEGRTKMITYTIIAEEIRIFAGLDMITGPDLDYTYEDIDIPDEIRDDFISILLSMTRTGIVELPESMALLADIPLIISLERTYYSQIYDTNVANACGPAAALMVLDFYGLEDSMDAVIERLQALPSPGAFDPGCYVNTVCTSPDALTMLLYDYGLQVDSHEEWTLSEVFAVIARGHPVIVDILWDPTSASLGHFVVIYGVNLDQELLYYHDPYHGREMTAYWGEFASLWEGRVDIGDPLKPEGHRFWGLEIGTYQ